MKRNGFTLIEMLIVVVIIAILAGMVFKLMGAGGASSDIAKTRRQLEMLANALEEFRAEYGKYPPVALNRNGVQPMRYEFPKPPEQWNPNAASLAGTLSGLSRDQSEVFTFGLVSYLIPRVEGNAEHAHEKLFDDGNGLKDAHIWYCQNSSGSSHAFDPGKMKDSNHDGKDDDTGRSMSTKVKRKDSSRDLRACNKIAPYINPIKYEWWSEHAYGNTMYTNRYWSVQDPWYHDLHYKSDPPYDSYRIWSDGPDGKDGTADDIVAGVEN